MPKYFELGSMAKPTISLKYYREISSETLKWLLSMFDKSLLPDSQISDCM